jgi:spore coat protein CotH
MMRTIFLLAIIIVFGSHKNLFGQTGFYDVSIVREVRIYFNESNWDHILDSLYVVGDEDRLLCNITIDGVPYDSVGIRYKGFSSVSTNRTKNPFNVKLDYVIDGQNHEGVDKLKLGNVIQDPSFVREILSYEIARKYMPAPEANYTNIYINDTLWGLYSSVEAVNKDFLAAHYGTRTHSFFKCNPASLDLSGENSNLGNSPGTDTADYYPYYDLKSDSGWEDLYNMIDSLNNHPDSVENFMNVDRMLWMHAFNYSLINFDSYVGYAQNYYLYKDHNGRFNPILWDLNMSFASYRLADASNFWNGFSIAEAQTMDPLLHYSSVSVYPRPLMRNLFNNDRYRRMYIAHMRTMMEENFANQDYATRAQFMQNLIDTDVANDTNKFYSYTDFQDNLNSTVSDLIDYPGITELMDARNTYLSTYPGFQGAPDLSNIGWTPQAISVGDDIWITIDVTNATDVILAYRFAGSEVFQKVDMLDDGSQNDGSAGDGTYGIQVSNIGNVVQYYFYAENDSAGRFFPERAAYEFFTLESTMGTQDVVINEFMASNTSIAVDDDGDYDDWIELHNNTNSPMSTGLFYLSDDFGLTNRWKMPDVLIEPGGYLIVWADEDTAQSALHANFRLNSATDSLMLTLDNGTVLDSITFQSQITDMTTGRYPNGTGPFMTLSPTFNGHNGFTDVVEFAAEHHHAIYPNPARESFQISLEDPVSRIEIRSMEGRLLSNQPVKRNERLITINISTYASGMYYVSLTYSDVVATEKIIIIR